MEQRKPPGPVPSGDARIVFNVRIKKASKEAIENRARDEGVTPADLARRLLAYAMASMPQGWGM
jgi:hypothetical protein